MLGGMGGAPAGALDCAGWGWAGALRWVEGRDWRGLRCGRGPPAGRGLSCLEREQGWRRQKALGTRVHASPCLWVSL